MRKDSFARDLARDTASERNTPEGDNSLQEHINRKLIVAYQHGIVTGLSIAEECGWKECRAIITRHGVDRLLCAALASFVRGLIDGGRQPETTRPQ